MTAKLFAGLKVGDRVLMVTQTDRYRVPKMEPRLEWRTVSKVGRQYGDASPEGEAPTKWNARRFELATGYCREGGGMHQVRFWHTEEEWRAHEGAKDAFRNLNRALQYQHDPAPGVSEADILTAAELLKLDIKP